MTRDRPLLVLVAAAVATYPALALGWCVTALMSTRSIAREMWLTTRPSALAAVALTIVAAIAITNAHRVLIRGLWQTHRLRRRLERHATPPTEPLRAVADELDIAGRVRLIATQEHVAITVGLWRPYIVLSDGLVTELRREQLRAVLTHERAHLRRRDPLRLLATRVLAAQLWFVPLAVDLRAHARRGYELGADRDAVDTCGRSAVAAALLRVGTMPATAPSVAAPFSVPELLRDRVEQLESEGPSPSESLSTARTLSTIAACLAFIAAVIGTWTFMLLACPCPGMPSL